MLRASCFACLVFLGTAVAQRGPVSTPKVRSVIQGSLIAPASTPFHLKASVTQGREQSPYGTVELSWLAPDRYRRTIHASNFDDDLIVDGSHVYERSSQEYFPLQLHTLTTAMLDPKPIIDAVQEGDRVATVSNGATDASGKRCLQSPKEQLCFQSNDGVHEIVAASGHSVDFSHYESFGGKKIARVLTNAPRLGEELITLTITSLEPLRTPSTDLLQSPSSGYTTSMLRVKALPESDLREHVVGPPDIIWPQPLDGATTGQASFYIAVDLAGKLREVQQLYTANERTNDSAISQLRQWQFRPFVENGHPVQAEGILRFELDTRKYGPSEPLTDAQARALAANTVSCKVDAASFPAGTKQTEWAAVDSEGHIIEILIGEDGVHGPHGTGIPCMQALQQWHFTPLMQDGKPVPFRAGIVFNIN